MIAPFVGFNWGWDVKAPWVSLPVEDAEDIEVLTSALSKVVPLGVRVASADVNKLLGFRVPDADEAILQIAPATASVESPVSERAHRLPHACPSCGERHLASAETEEDPLVSEALEHWEADVGPTVATIMAAAKAADNYDDFLTGLSQIAPDMAAMADRVAIQTMKARGDGDIDG